MSGDSSLLFKMVAKIILFSVLFLIFIPVSYAVTQTECESGGGNWTEKIGCDPREGEICPQYFCQCEDGFTWEEDRCVKEVVSAKVLCESSDGIWENGTCICPPHSEGLRDGRCIYKMTLDEPDSQQSLKQTIGSKGVSKNIAIIAVICVIVIVGVIFFKKRMM